MARRIVTLVVIVLGLVAWRPSVARADATDQLIKQLEDDSKNVRLAAAVNLAKQSDPRIILPFVKVLGNDSDAQVRSVAAAGLGRLVTSSTKPVLRDLATKTLTIASTQDDSGDVRKQALASLKLIKGGGGGGGGDGPDDGPNKGIVASGGGGGGGVYVNLGPMSSKTGGTDDTKLRDLMVRTATKTLAKSEPTYLLTWPGGAPTKAALDKKKVAGFYVDGTLNELTEKDSGSSSTISCKVSMLLASYPEKSVFGFLNGGAKVQASSSASDKLLAHQDCVEAVISDLIAKKILPTIHTKVSP